MDTISTAQDYANWDEGKHPRVPAGGHGGGEFAPKITPSSSDHEFGTIDPYVYHLTGWKEFRRIRAVGVLEASAKGYSGAGVYFGNTEGVARSYYRSAGAMLRVKKEFLIMTHGVFRSGGKIEYDEGTGEVILPGETSSVPTSALEVYSDLKRTWVPVLQYKGASYSCFALRDYAGWDPTGHPRGKTTSGSRGGSFAPAQTRLQEVRKLARESKVYLNVDSRFSPDTWFLEGVEREEGSEKGSGARVMSALVKAADFEGKRIVLYPVDKVVSKYFERFGFGRSDVPLKDQPWKESLLGARHLVRLPIRRSYSCLALTSPSGTVLPVLAYVDGVGQVYRLRTGQPPAPAPRIADSLYVSRPVLNAPQIIAWAKAQGFATTLPPEDMHVTVAFSKEPVDWGGLDHMGDTLEIPGTGVVEYLEASQSSSNFGTRLLWLAKDLVVVSASAEVYEEEGVWRTIRGRKVFLGKGEDPTQAIAKSKLEEDHESTSPVAGLLASSTLRKVFHYQPLSADSIKALNRYVTTVATPLNNLLREAGANELDSALTESRDTTAALDRAFGDISPTSVVFTVSRAIRRDTGWDAVTLKEGMIVQDHGFVSTSLSKQVAVNHLGEGNAIFDIRVPPGSKALSLPSVKGLDSDFISREAEVLLPRGSTFRITSVEKNVVQAELLPHGQHAVYSEHHVGGRSVIQLGEDEAAVLVFEAPPLRERWQVFRDHGASWDYGDDYRPHVTLSYDPPADLSSIQPYVGPIVLGPERWAEVQSGWAEDVREYATDYGGYPGVWRTIRGRRVFIRKGETPTMAVVRSIAEAPDKPLKPTGKWQKIKNSVVAWHGTIKRNLEAIKRNGIVVKAGKRTFGDPASSALYNDERGRSVFVTNRWQTAMWYARQHESGTPVVIELRVPKSEFSRFLRDTEHEGKGAAYTAGKIKPEWITKAYQYDRFEGKVPIKFTQTAGDIQVWIVIVVDGQDVPTVLARADADGRVHPYLTARDVHSDTPLTQITLAPFKLCKDCSGSTAPTCRRNRKCLGPPTVEEKALTAFYAQPKASSIVDYAQVKRDLDALEAKAKAALIPLLKTARDALISQVKRQGHDLHALAREVKLSGVPALRGALRGMLQQAWDKGGQDARKEVLGAKAYADPTFTPRGALKWLRTKVFWITDLLDGQITDDARAVLIRALKIGETLSETIDRLWKLFEPYIGDPTVLKDGEPLAPYRLETIVRTNTTDAYNHGRLTEFIRPDLLPFLDGIRYSAILDTRTTEVCRFLDNKVFKPDSPDLAGLLPPRHFNCRSLIVPTSVSEELDAADFITPAQVARAHALSGKGFAAEDTEVHEFYDPDQPRVPAGSVEGGQFASTGGGQYYKDAPLDGKGAAAWRRRMQRLYDTNPEFRASADATMLFTQGEYNHVRAMAVRSITGEFPEAYKDSQLPRWYDESIPLHGNPLSNYRKYFEGQPFLPGKEEFASKASWKAGAKALNDSIRTTAPLSVPIYRGVHGRENLDKLLAMKPGATFDMVGPTSFTADRVQAVQFATGTAAGQGKGRPFDRFSIRSAIITVEPGARGIAVQALSPWRQQEVISGGRFKVKAVDKDPVHGFPRVLVKQVAVFRNTKK